MAKVKIPKPPNWNKHMIMIWPNGVKKAPVSFTARPVIHTALVAVNKASTNAIWPYVAFGIISKNVPSKISNKKLKINNWAGCATTILKLNSITNNWRIKETNNAIFISDFSNKNLYKKELLSAKKCVTNNAMTNKAMDKSNVSTSFERIPFCTYWLNNSIKLSPSTIK